MLPEPLHPAVVHFPIVLSVLLPFFAVGALLAISRGAAPWRAWALPLALAVALTASSFIALRTGEAQEDRVEEVVGEEPIHEHEEAAERFMLFSGILTALAAAGLVGGSVGSASRIFATVSSVVVLAAGYQVGDLGGRLVYEHGAAEAYVDGPTPPGSGGVDAGR